MAFTYQKTLDGITGATLDAVIRSDGLHIPADPANLEWRAYQSWVAAGNSATPPTPPAPVPITAITNFQARAQAIADGHFDAIDATVKGSNNATAIAAWDYANVFERDSPFIDLLEANTPYNTPALLDTFFANASKLG